MQWPVAPDIFKLDDDDNLIVLNETPGEASRDRILEAVRVCPKQAISIDEE